MVRYIFRKVPIHSLIFEQHMPVHFLRFAHHTDTFLNFCASHRYISSSTTYYLVRNRQVFKTGIMLYIFKSTMHLFRTQPTIFQNGHNAGTFLKIQHISNLVCNRQVFKTGIMLAHFETYNALISYAIDKFSIRA